MACQDQRPVGAEISLSVKPVNNRTVTIITVCNNDHELIVVQSKKQCYNR